jgi:hypothetical protein
MRIADGTAETHETPLPLDASHSPAVAAPTPAFPSGNQQGGVRDLTGERLAALAASAAECAAAQSAGMGADSDRRGRYAAAMAPLGSGPTDEMTLPVVPANAVPPAMSDLYPYAGMEPTPAAAGFEDPGYGT